MSFSSKEVKNARDLVPADEPIAIVIGAMAHGQVSRSFYDFFLIFISKHIHCFLSLHNDGNKLLFL